MWGVEFRVEGFRFAGPPVLRVFVRLHLRVLGLRFRVQDSGFRIQDSGLRVYG